MNGNVYKGEWKDDMADGDGTLSYSNGDLYEGLWKNNLRDGQGNFTCAKDGYIYSGSWARGCKNGIGSITMPSTKDVFKGEFLDGRLVGPKLSDGSLVWAFAEDSDWANVDSNAF